MLDSDENVNESTPVLLLEDCSVIQLAFSVEARAVSENIIYIAAGLNVRHISVDEVRSHLVSQSQQNS